VKVDKFSNEGATFGHVPAPTLAGKFVWGGGTANMRQLGNQKNIFLFENNNTSIFALPCNRPTFHSRTLKGMTNIPSALKFHTFTLNSTVTYREAGWLGFDSRQGKRFFSIPQHPYRNWAPPPQPPPHWVMEALSPWDEADHSPSSSTVFKNGGDIPPLPHTPSWSSA
jgi:hypothetical protein